MKKLSKTLFFISLLFCINITAQLFSEGKTTWAIICAFWTTFAAITFIHGEL